ncbi:MAG: hypothetical protein V1819_01165 [bacterium]
MFIYGADPKLGSSLGQEVSVFRRNRYGGWTFCLSGILEKFFNNNGHSTAIVKKMEGENEPDTERVVEIDEKVIFVFSQ